MIMLLVYIARAVILILVMWFICNLIGKKSLAQLTPYDVAILFVISNVVSQPLVTKDSLKTAIGVMILGMSILLISKVSMARGFYAVNFRPSVLVSNGTVIREELKRNNINLYLLLSMLRIQGFFKLSDVQTVILEMNGQISVIPKCTARPPTTQEMNLNVPQDDMSYLVIIEGEINRNILPTAKIEEDWLIETLHSNFHVKPEQVYYGEIDQNKNLSIHLYSAV